MAATLLIPACGTSNPRNQRQALPAPGLLVSLALHGVALALLAGWNGGAADSPKGIEVSIVMEDAAEEHSPMTTATPPSTSNQAQAKPPIQPHPVTRNSAAGPARRSAPPLPDTAYSEPGPVQIEPNANTATMVQGSESGDPRRTAGKPGIDRQGGQMDGGAADRPALPSAGNPAPLYPMVARRASREGRTVLLVSVDADGACGDVRIEVSSGTPSLDEAAVAAVRHWRFTPAQNAGRTVSSIIRVPVLFRLSGAS